jgi:hypothetical protein
MNRLILILILLGIGIYVYIVLFNNTNYFTSQVHQNRSNNIELINDEFIEQPLNNNRKNNYNHNKHVHFSERNTEYIIPHKSEEKINNLYDDIFIVDPIEMKNTDLTLSENEYFNN